MADEFESKFIFNDGLADAEMFLNKQHKFKLSRITQFYFISNFAHVSFDLEQYRWKISLKDTDSAMFIPANAEEVPEIKDVLSLVAEANLIDVEKSSFRVRNKDGIMLFTAKFAGFKEFEYEFTPAKQFIDRVMAVMPSVFKKRYSFDYLDTKTTVDLDFFDQPVNGIDHLLEFEFETLADLQEFDPEVEGLNLTNVDDDKSYKNINIAKCLFELNKAW